MGGDQRADLRAAAWLAALFFFFYLIFDHGHFNGSDEVGVYETTRSLWERGSLDVPPVLAKLPHFYRGRDGGLYSHFAVGQSVLALPFYGFGKLLDSSLPEAWRSALAGPQPSPQGGSVEIFAVSLYAPFASALLIGLFYLFQRSLATTARSALIVSVLLGSTTYVAMMSVYHLRHTTEALAALGSLYAFHRFRQGHNLGALAAGSFLASSILLIRVPSVIAGPGLAGYALWALFAARHEDDSLRGPRPWLAARSPRGARARSARRNQ